MWKELRRVHEIFTRSCSEDTVEGDPWFFCFSQCDGVVCDIALRFQWLWPPPFFFLTLKPSPTPTPTSTPSSSSSHAIRLRFTLIAVRLRSLVGNRLHLGRGVVHLRLAFSVIFLHSLTAVGRNIQLDSVSCKSLSLSFTALSCLLCHIFKEKRGKNGAKKHARCFEGICFPSLELNAFHT